MVDTARHTTRVETPATRPASGGFLRFATTPAGGGNAPGYLLGSPPLKPDTARETRLESGIISSTGEASQLNRGLQVVSQALGDRAEEQDIEQLNAQHRAKPWRAREACGRVAVLKNNEKEQRRSIKYQSFWVRRDRLPAHDIVDQAMGAVGPIRGSGFGLEPKRV